MTIPGDELSQSVRVESEDDETDLDMPELVESTSASEDESCKHWWTMARDEEDDEDDEEDDEDDEEDDEVDYEIWPSHFRAELANNDRAPRTGITFGWMSGDPGILTLQFGEGQISNKDVEWANTTYRDRLHVQLMEQVLGLNHEDVGLLVLDPGPAHIAWTHGEAIRRDTLCEEMNIVLEILLGGMSAHFQPLDQLHQLWRSYSQLYAKLKLGEYDNIYLRVHPRDIPRTKKGGNLKGLTNRESITGDHTHIC